MQTTTTKSMPVAADHPLGETDCTIEMQKLN